VAFEDDAEVVAVDNGFAPGVDVDEEGPPVAAFDEVPALTVESAVGIIAVKLAPVWVATAIEEDADETAKVAAAPLPVDVRTAGRRDPTLSLETQEPATLLLMS
jgi:hypothetical protein